MMREYAIIKKSEKRTGKIVEIKKRINKTKRIRAKKQVAHSIMAKSSGRANQLTAQNTALSYETQLDMQDTQLEILKNVSTTNRLLAEQMEDKRKKEIEKRKDYGFKRSGAKK